MTREEAIAFFKDMNECTYGDVEPILMAIEALEHKPCEDAISREDALQALCKAVHKNDDTIPCRNQIVSCLWDKTKVQDYAKEILKLPSVTPVGQKVGHWISIGDFECRCSECLLWCYKRNRSRYCPSCGAKMQEVKNNEIDN